MKSRKWSLNETDMKKWFYSALEWVAPLGLIYFGQIAIYIADGFSVQDFIPNNALQGALALYVVNQLYGLSKRFSAGK